MIKKTIPSVKAAAATAAKPTSTLLNNQEWSKWQKPPRQTQGTLTMGFTS